MTPRADVCGKQLIKRAAAAPEDKRVHNIITGQKGSAGLCSPPLVGTIWDIRVKRTQFSTSGSVFCVTSDLLTLHFQLSATSARRYVRLWSWRSEKPCRSWRRVKVRCQTGSAAIFSAVLCFIWEFSLFQLVWEPFIPKLIKSAFKIVSIFLSSGSNLEKLQLLITYWN